MGMSEKGKMFGFHWFLFSCATFWTSFVISAAAHLCFSGVPGISNTPRIISPWKANKMALNLALSLKFSQPYVRPPISFIFLSLQSKEASLAIVGMSGKGGNGNVWFSVTVRSLQITQIHLGKL